MLLLNPTPQTLPISTRKGWNDYKHPTITPTTAAKGLWEKQVWAKSQEHHTPSKLPGYADMAGDHTLRKLWPGDTLQSVMLGHREGSSGPESIHLAPWDASC